MLSNAYFLAKFRFDTAENEPAKKCKILNFCNNYENVDFAHLPSLEVRRRAPRALPRRGGAPRALLHADLRRGLRLAARARAAGPGPPRRARSCEISLHVSKINSTK